MEGIRANRIRIDRGWSVRAGLAALAALVAAGCTRSAPALAVKRDVVATLRLAGNVVAPPTAVYTAYPPYQTTVKKVDASVNEQVHKGDRLIELVIPSADQAVQAARANLRQAEAALAEAKRNDAATVRAARQELNAARSEQRAADQSQSNSTNANPPAADTGNGTAATTSSGTPAAGGSGPPPAVDRQAAAQAVAQAQAQGAASLAPLEEQVADARRALADAQAGREQGIIRSGITGTVIVLNAQTGKAVGQNRDTPLASVVNLRKLQVQAPLTPEQVAYAKVGTPVKLSTASVPNRLFDGRIVQVTTVADKSGKVTSYMATIDFDNREHLVMPNQKAVASIELGAAHDVVAVPNGALQRDSSGKTVVQVLRNGHWVTTPVTVGLSDGAYTEIKRGIEAGEQVKVNKPLL